MTTVSTRPYVPARRVTVDGITYDVAEGRSVVDIDRDLAWQNGQWANDSWFVVSNLDSGGQRIGFQVHLLIMYLPAGGAVVSLNAGVVNETARLSRSLEFAGHPDWTGCCPCHRNTVLTCSLQPEHCGAGRGRGNFDPVRGYMSLLGR